MRAEMIAIDNQRIARCHEDHNYVATECRRAEYVSAAWDDTLNCVLEIHYGPNFSDFNLTYHWS